MFNRDEFSKILIKINSTYATMSDFATKASFDRTYISKYINKKLKNPPTPKILEKIAFASNGVSTYEELMIVCGYIKSNDDIVYVAYNAFIDLEADIISSKDLNNIIKDFYNYCNKIIQDLENEELSTKFISIRNFTNGINEPLFLILYEPLIKFLENKQLIDTLSDKLFLPSSYPYQVLKHDAYSIRTIQNYIVYYIETIKQLYNSKYDPKKFELLNKNNVTTPDQLRYLVRNDAVDVQSTMNTLYNNSNAEMLFYIPILGKIAAGKPILADEYIEGYIPINPNIYGMTTPDDYFYLLVSRQFNELKS